MNNYLSWKCLIEVGHQRHANPDLVIMNSKSGKCVYEIIFIDNKALLKVEYLNNKENNVVLKFESDTVQEAKKIANFHNKKMKNLQKN